MDSKPLLLSPEQREEMEGLRQDPLQSVDETGVGGHTPSKREKRRTSGENSWSRLPLALSSPLFEGIVLEFLLLEIHLFPHRCRKIDLKPKFRLIYM